MAHRPGFSVFITSWKNPTAEMANTSFDDYLRAVDEVVQASCNSARCHRWRSPPIASAARWFRTYMAWANRHYGEKKMPVAAGHCSRR